MKLLKRILLSIIIMGIAVPITINGADVKSQKLYSKYYLPYVDLGKPFNQFSPVDSVFGIENGHDVVYSTSNGSPAVFCAYDLDDRKVLFSSELSNGHKSAWSHAIAKDGTVYIAADGAIFRYIPSEKKFEDIGGLVGEKAYYGLCFDEDGNMYVGTFPGGKIIKYDIKTKEYIDLGQLVPEHQYVRSLTYKDGYLYGGTFGDTPRFVKVNAKKPSEKTIIPLPADDDWFKLSEMKWLYNMNLVGDLIFINGKAKTTAPLLIFDTKSQQFINHGFKSSYRGICTSPERNGKTYFASGINLWEYDLATNKITNTGLELGSAGFYGAGWITLENEPDFPGESLVTLNNADGTPLVFNLQTKKVKNFIDIELKGGYGHFHSVEKGDGMNLYLGCYMGTKAAVYNTETGKLTYMPSHQPESILYYNGKGYFGTYTGAHIQQYDPSQPISSSNPTWLWQLGDEQDRPYKMIGADNKVFIASYPTYGKLGGALSIYNTQTGEKDVYRNIVENQSVMSLAYKDGLLYGSTSVWGGIGIDPSESKAKIFVFDVAAKKKIAEFVPEIPGITENVYSLGDISFGPDGLLWVSSRFMVFAIDTKTNKVVKQHIIAKPSTLTTAMYRPVYIRWDDNGLLYTIASAQGITILDTETMETRMLEEQVGGRIPITLMTIGPDGNIYYNNYFEGNSMKMIPVSNIDFKEADISASINKLKNAVSLYINKNNAVVNGAVKPIDSGNEAVVPVVENGRTLVPVRFIAEAFGVNVNWEDATQTVTLSGKSNIKIKLNQPSMTVDGKEIALDVPATTKDGRTLLPLRALTESLGKQVHWEDEGLIIISDSLWSEETLTTKKVGLTMKYYLNRITQQNEGKNSAFEDYKKEIATMGTPIPITNAGFEEESTDGKITGWTQTSKTTGDNYLEQSTGFSFEGEKSLHIIDKISDPQIADTTLESDLIEIDPTKNYTLSTMLYIHSGRTSIGMFYYNKDKVLIPNSRIDQHIQTDLKKWQHIKIDNPIPSSAKYVKVRLYTSPYFMSDCYYDNVTLFEK